MTAHRAVHAAIGASIALLALSACGTQSAAPGAHEHQTSAPSSEADGDETFNEHDVLFSQRMIPHHAQAVEMAEIVLTKDGVDPQVTELAQQIRAAQGPEIEQMTDWLDGWGEAVEVDHAGMGHGMEGMLTDDAIQQLRQADGEDTARLFLEGMVAHHEGAIAMAQEELRAGAHPEVLALAERIIAGQQAEIDSMQKMLGSE